LTSCGFQVLETIWSRRPCRATRNVMQACIPHITRRFMNRKVYYKFLRVVWNRLILHEQNWR
jgi:hypothetical protein